MSGDTSSSKRELEKLGGNSGKDQKPTRDKRDGKQPKGQKRQYEDNYTGGGHISNDFSHMSIEKERNGQASRSEEKSGKNDHLDMTFPDGKRASVPRSQMMKRLNEWINTGQDWEKVDRLQDGWEKVGKQKVDKLQDGWEKVGKPEN